MTEVEARFILGVSPNCSPDELRRAYRSAAAANHPDRGGNPERMVLINAAYALLSNGDWRTRHSTESAPPPTPPDPQANDSTESPPERDAPTPSQPPAAEDVAATYVNRLAALVAIGAAAATAVTARSRSDIWVAPLVGGIVYVWSLWVGRMLLLPLVRAIAAFVLRCAPWLRSAFSGRSGEPQSESRGGGVMRVKAFFIGVLKVSSAIFVVAAIIGGAAWWVMDARDRNRKAAELPLAQTKTWPTMTAEALGGAKFDVATMWRDGHIFYRFTVVGIGEAITKAREDTDSNPTFIIQFQNASGFKIREKRIELHDMVGMMGSDGTYSGFTWSDTEYLSADDYRDAASWQILWAGFPSTPPRRPIQTASLSPRTKSETAHRAADPWASLHKGSTEAEVQALLGPPLHVVGVGAGDDDSGWFYEGSGRVWFVQHHVDSWEVPQSE